MRRIQIWFLVLLVLIGNASLSGSPAQLVEEVPTIAFASFATIKTHIFIADPDGNNAKPLLASPDVDYNPSFSRDGSWIVFTSNRGGSADIYRVRADGSDRSNSLTIARLTTKACSPRTAIP
jgi:Tol biopolymer transport system component